VARDEGPENYKKKKEGKPQKLFKEIEEYINK
jgi:hypothetical protein